jgi:hypothetical protein
MDEAEKEAFAAAMGGEVKEPDTVNTPESVTPSGRVEQKEQETTEAAEEAWERPSDDDVKKMQNWVNGLISEYSTVKEDGERDWNLDKILEERGYDPKSLRKQGEKVDSEQEQATEKAANDKVIKSFNEEQLAFIKQMQEDTIKKVMSEVEPLKKESSESKVTTMVNTLKEKYSDFEQHGKEIGEFIKSTNAKVTNAKQLEQIYFAVKGVKSAQSETPEKAGSLPKGATTGHLSKVGTPSLEDEVFGQMMSAGAEVEKKTNVEALFGKGTLKPI